MVWFVVASGYDGSNPAEPVQSTNPKKYSRRLKICDFNPTWLFSVSKDNKQQQSQ